MSRKFIFAMVALMVVGASLMTFYSPSCGTPTAAVHGYCK